MNCYINTFSLKLFGGANTTYGNFYNSSLGSQLQCEHEPISFATSQLSIIQVQHWWPFPGLETGSFTTTFTHHSCTQLHKNDHNNCAMWKKDNIQKLLELISVCMCATNSANQQKKVNQTRHIDRYSPCNNQQFTMQQQTHTLC